MLIVPLSGKISWRNPPWITIAIILINCFIFFVFQSGDDDRYREAMSFYLESGLAQIEISDYLAYLEATTGDGKIAALRNQEKIDQQTLFELYRRMQRDRDFLQKLYNDEIIRPRHEQYGAWKQLRSAYEQSLSRLTSRRYGFIPARMTILTAFTHMFLHGHFMHLLGNMVFLWLVGCVLETGWGRAAYAVTYAATGLLAVGLYALVNLGSYIPLVGASGAVSGLIGAYTVSYGKSRIKVFYSLGFYFDYIKVRAILLLPAWIAVELLQWLFGQDSGVAYTAHVGGLAGGALLAFVNLKFLGMVDREVFAEDPKERIHVLQNRVASLMENLEMDEVRKTLQQILEIDPDNRSALYRLYQIDKLTPQSPAFHATASRLLVHLSSEKADHEALHGICQEYLRLSKPPRLHPDILLRLSKVFAASGRLGEAEKLAAFVLKKAPNSDMLPSALLALGRSYIEKGMAKKGRQCLMVLSRRFPDSLESRTAKGLLKASPKP